MNTIDKCILTVAFFLISLCATAQNYAITQRGEKGTLTDNYVHSIYKDADGFIWVGTGTTVERFDGVRNLTYPFEGVGETPVYAASLVNALLETHPHEYWVGSVSGLWRLNHSKRMAERMFPEQINCPVQALAKDSRNHLYIGTTNGLYVYDGQQLHHSIIDAKSSYPDDNHVTGIALSDDANCWLLTLKGVALYDSRSGAAKIYPNTLPDCGRLTNLQKVKDVLYIGTEKRGIVTFDLKTYRFQSYWEGIKAPVTQLSYEDGLLAVATYGQGIYVLDLTKRQSVYSASYHTDQSKGLLSNNISSILLSQGDIWCGTSYYLGMNYLRNVHAPFRLYEKGTFLSKEITVRSCLHGGGYSYIGTREGFYCISESDNSVRLLKCDEDNKEKLRSNLIFSFYPYDDYVLVGTCGGGVSAWYPQKGTFIDTPLTETLLSNDVFMFKEDADGTLWVASTTGLFAYDRRTRKVTEYNAANSGMPGNIVYGICLDSSGRFWVGTDKGLALFDRRTGKCTQANLPQGINTGAAFRAICEGRDGRLFFFQLGYRTHTVDKDLKQLQPILTASGSFNMTQDADGFYWFATGLGVVRVDEKLARFTLFPLGEPIDVEMGCTAGAAIEKDTQGNLWIPCAKGLVIADPKQHFHISPLAITDVLVNGEPYISNNEMHPDSILGINRAGNNLTFRFVSLGYERPDLMRYEYRLEGHDSIWQQVLGKNEVSFYNLPGGDYTFRVRKMLNEETTASLSFTIEESHAWMGYVAGAVVLVAVGLWLVWRTRKSKGVQPQAALMPSGEEEQEDAKEEPQSSENYVKLSDEEAQAVIDALKAYMEKEKPYLNVDLKQSEVAAAIGHSAYLLSAVFTHYLKMGYYDFINRYRVEEVKQAIKAGQHEKYTLVTLAEKCGFKSKSSFFRTFKKFTGFTPNEYIQQQDKK